MAVLTFSVGTVLSVVLQRHLLGGLQTAQHLVEFNVGEAFGLAAILSLVLAGSREGVTLAASDVAVLLLSALAWFVPEQHGIYLAMTLGGSWILLRRRSNRRLADIGPVWLALSFYVLWGKLLFKLAYQMIEVGLSVGRPPLDRTMREVARGERSEVVWRVGLPPTRLTGPLECLPTGSVP